MTEREPNPVVDPYQLAAWWIYEAARLEASASQRPVVPEPWNERSPDFRRQMVRYVRQLITDLKAGKQLPTPREAHESWVRAYERMGWRYGPVRDPEGKFHPDMVPYDELSDAERAKDEIFLDLVRLAAKWIVP